MNKRSESQLHTLRQDWRPFLSIGISPRPNRQLAFQLCPTSVRRARCWLQDLLSSSSSNPTRRSMLVVCLIPTRCKIEQNKTELSINNENPSSDTHNIKFIASQITFVYVWLSFENYLSSLDLFQNNLYPKSFFSQNNPKIQKIALRDDMKKM